MIFEKKFLGLYKKELLKRADDIGVVFYYSYKDFEGLNAEPYIFYGNNGQKLSGAFYFYEEKQTDRIVIFEHGIGGGHRSYMKEIELLAKNGYTVLSYDHTGCMESEGENICSFAQSINDLDHCITSLRNKDEYKNTDISVIGHSWGGMSVLNIGALHPDISHIVSISAPISVRAMVSQIFHGILKFYVPAIMSFEKEVNPKYANLTAVDALKCTNAKALIIHSNDDKIVKRSVHFDVLKKSMQGRQNTEFMLVSGKKHNPNYTVDAIEYMDKFSSDLSKKIKSNYFSTDEIKIAFKNSYDFDRMTKQDMTVWDEIFDFLKN